MSSLISQLLNMVEDFRGNIEMPEINDPYLRTIWMMGRNAGANKIRLHVRHHIGNDLPYLKKAPKAFREQLGESVSEVWLSGYNEAIFYIEKQVNALMFSQG